MEFYLAIKNEMSFAEKSTELENILSKISQIQKVKGNIFSMWKLEGGKGKEEGVS